MVRGTKAETVIEAVKHIEEDGREKVQEVTMDLSESMRKIVEACFPRATRVIDRFHVQKLALEAVQEIRIKRRWEAIDADNKSRAIARRNGEDYAPYTFDNGDTRKELLARSRYALYKSPEKWTQSQRERAETMFREYPDLESLLAGAAPEDRLQQKVTEVRRKAQPGEMVQRSGGLRLRLLPNARWNHQGTL